jgi:hypothetical protein
MTYFQPNHHYLKCYMELFNKMTTGVNFSALDLHF